MIFIWKGIHSSSSLRFLNFYFILIVSFVFHLMLLFYANHKFYFPQQIAETHSAHKINVTLKRNIDSTRAQAVLPREQIVSPRAQTVSPREQTVSPRAQTVSPRGSTTGSRQKTQDDNRKPTQDDNKQLPLSNPFGVLALPKSVLSQNLFPRKYQAVFALKSSHDALESVVLKQLLPLSEPLNYLDKMVTASFQKQLQNIPMTSLKSWINNFISLQDGDMMFNLSIEFNEQGPM